MVYSPYLWAIRRGLLIRLFTHPCLPEAPSPCYNSIKLIPLSQGSNQMSFICPSESFIYSQRIQSPRLLSSRLGIRATSFDILFSMTNRETQGTTFKGGYMDMIQIGLHVPIHLAHCPKEPLVLYPSPIAMYTYYLLIFTPHHLPIHTMLMVWPTAKVLLCISAQSIQFGPRSFHLTAVCLS